MLNYSIGLSGLNAAQRALELIGTNLANSTTPGYHRQDLALAPIDLGSNQGVSIGGVQVTEARRMIDEMLEKEIRRQASLAAQNDQEVQTLQTIENSLGDLQSSDLSRCLNGFFSAMQEMAGDPSSLALQQQVVSAGQSLSGQIRSLWGFLEQLKDQLRMQAQQQVSEVNALAAEVADLNGQAGSVISNGQQPNLLLDRRDQALNDLAQRVSVSQFGLTDATLSVNISAWGMPVVDRTRSMELAAGITPDGKLGLAAADSVIYYSDLEGGSLGGLLNLYNNVIPDICSRLDGLARDVISRVNAVHAQGVGQEGSFTELAGIAKNEQPIGAWDPPIQPGTLSIRITNTDTGEVTRQRVSLSPDMTLSDVADDINCGALTATVAGGALYLKAAGGYEFDFTTGFTTQPYVRNPRLAIAPILSGQYTGQTDNFFQFAVMGNGDVGVSDNLQIRVTDSNNKQVALLDVGKGYVAGQRLEVADGMYVTLPPGNLKIGDYFVVEALSTPDASGFLSAAGLNTFFSGTSAADMDVRQEVADRPTLLAYSSSTVETRNDIIRQMADLAQAASESLGGMAPVNYFRQLVTSIGQGVSDAKGKQASLAAVGTQLTNQRSAVSGVDVNEEAAKMMVFQRMYQGLAKYISMQDQALRALFDMV